jgi:hypothetical protein
MTEEIQLTTTDDMVATACKIYGLARVLDLESYGHDHEASVVEDWNNGKDKVFVNVLSSVAKAIQEQALKLIAIESHEEGKLYDQRKASQQEAVRKEG